MPEKYIFRDDEKQEKPTPTKGIVGGPDMEPTPVEEVQKTDNETTKSE